MVLGIHHVGIVVKRLRDAYAFYQGTLGLPLLREADVADQGVRAALLGAGDTEIELLEPLDLENGVGRFLTKRGEGLHHLCLETPSVGAELAELSRRGVPLIDQAPRRGLAGQIAFLHPKACAGVLVELATPDHRRDSAPAAPLHLKRLVIGAREPKHTVSAFQSLFSLPEMAMNGGPRTMLTVGQGALLVVPAEEVGGSEGMVALSLVAEDFEALIGACDRGRVTLLRGTGEVTIEPTSSHGVHLHISKYRFP